MPFSFRLLAVVGLCASSTNAFAAPKAKSQNSSIDVLGSAQKQSGDWQDEPLEARWNWRGRYNLASNGSARVFFGWKEPKDGWQLAVLRVGTQRFLALGESRNGNQQPNHFQIAIPQTGELELQKIGTTLRVLLNGELVHTRQNVKLPGSKFGVFISEKSKITLEDNAPQPTERAVFRDDFMRAQGPDDAEIPGEWRTVGSWKTSGALGPKSDAALNPNPFVFRAQGDKQNLARAGKWFWSDYVVSASMRATLVDETQPLVGALEAFRGTSGAIRGEIDFRAGVARLKSGNKVLAQSARFDAGIGQWHRVKLEPGPGVARLVVDGVERVRANTKRAGGEIALGAWAGGENFVDFDDVRVGARGETGAWGEGTLPERFQKDRLMRFWADPSRAWKRSASGVWWHTGDFFGAANLEMPLPELENGDGLNVWRASGKPQKISPRLRIVRRGNNVEFEFPGSATKTVSRRVDELKNARLTFKNAPINATSSRLELLVDEKVIASSTTPRTNENIKIGIEPTQNNRPIPAPALQPVSLSPLTFEREGRAVVGVNITPVSAEIAREVGLPDASGAIVDNVEAESPALKAGILVGDVVRGVNGTKVSDVDSMRAAVALVKPGQSVKLDLLRPARDLSGVDWANALVRTPGVVDYAFTTAPVDWRAARGRWEVAERWTCSPQWSFFAGQHDVAPLLWSRFAANGDYTLEAYLATPMDLARGERSPSDLNISVESDGRNPGSGYSFLFAANGRTQNRIYRGDEIVVQKPFELPPGAGDTHQDWFYVRLERRATPQGLRFKWSVNGRELANYLDPKPLKNGGAVGFWTQNGGLSLARVRLWHSGLAGQSQSAKVLPVAVRLSLAPASSSMRAVALNVDENLSSTGTVHTFTNQQPGGDWLATVSRAGFDPKDHPVLEWEYRLTPDVKLNLYAKIDGKWREIVWSGPMSRAQNGAGGRLGGVSAVADGRWQRARFDLAAALRANGLDGKRVESLVFAAPDADYLRAGLGGNHAGASWQLRGMNAMVGF